jgi:hypothetical protein
MKGAWLALSVSPLGHVSCGRVHRPQRRRVLASTRRCLTAEHTDAPNGNRFELADGPTAASKEDPSVRSVFREVRICDLVSEPSLFETGSLVCPE